MHVPALDAVLSQVDFAVGVGGEKVLPTPAGCLLPALAVGIAAHVFRLHTRISDVLGIGEVFDLEVIVAEFADQFFRRGTQRSFSLAPNLIMRAPLGSAPARRLGIRRS